MSILPAVAARTLGVLCLGACLVSLPTMTIAQQSSPPNIAQVASGNENFSTLVKALDAAGLVETIATGGPFTVFAPTNDAFGKLDQSTVASLLKPENKPALTSVLTYHVVPGRLTAADLLRSPTVTTVQGQTLSVRFQDGSLKVNDSTIVSIDIPASNGVIHVIDAVLLPSSNEGNAMTDTSTPGPRAARELIERAIKRGVPFFNEGQPDACVAVYGITCRAIIGIGADNVPAEVVDVLRDALNDANREHQPSERAWILRRGLDRAAEILEKMPQTKAG